MRCVALVVNWMIGDVGGVDDRRGGKGLAKWMGGGVHGIVMVERESCVVCGKNWLALSRISG